MQPQVENRPEEKTIQQQTIATNSVDTGSKSVEEASPEIKSEENKTNWKAFREQRESERKAREAAEKRASEKDAEAQALKAALEAIVNKPSNIHQTSSGYIEESEEDRIQRKIDETVNKRLDQERLRMQEEQRKQDLQTAPQRIVQTYPDFNNVVTTENCDYLDYHYPEVTAPFAYMPDGVEKWAAMYRAIKKFVPNTDSRKDQARADKNMQKPGSISAPGTAQGSNAMGSAVLDDARKASNWERMQKTLKGLS